MVKKIIATVFLAVSMLFGMSVDELNSASKDDLMAIKGIGEKKAEAIIAERTKAKFTSIEDVASRVKGVGAVIAKNIAEDVRSKTTMATESNTTKPTNTTKLVEKNTTIDSNFTVIK